MKSLIISILACCLLMLAGCGNSSPDKKTSAVEESSDAESSAVESESSEQLPEASLDYFSGVQASSELTDEDGVSYPVSNLMLCNSKTWVEGVDGPGIGVKIRYTYEQPVRMKTIGIVNGFGDLSLYHKNNRVKTLKITNEKGESRTLGLRDTYAVQNYSIDELDGTSFDFEIEDVYPGTQQDNTCLAAMIPGGLYNSTFSYSIDFYYLLVPKAYQVRKAEISHWQASMTKYDMEHGTDECSNPSIEHYDQFLQEYPEFAEDFPVYDEIPMSEYEIEGYFDGVGFTYTVFPADYQHNGENFCSKKTFILTGDDDSLVFKTGNSLDFELNGESVPVGRYITLPSLDEVFGVDIPNGITEVYDYSNGVLTVYFFDQEHPSYPYKNYDPLKSISYRWNGERFILDDDS